LPAKSYRAPRWQGAVALAVGFVLLAGIGQTSIGHAVLVKAGLFERPANYTSLAFAQPQTLPEQLTSRQNNVDISFVISNVHEPYHAYRWSMQLVQIGHTRRVVAGSVNVASGKGVKITKSAKISCTQGKVQVIVSLVQPAEAIYAWIACPTHKTEKHEPPSKDAN
jgi:4-hydroxy-L-threonine phosphate dehydrogenase PdxA